ncbi:MAG: glycoside hydrolase family 127 protein, partial [Kiritimatiellae bacterium]|nr:glycoside hydrolase family 127 protein [Kiritimatiellia bacterium]
RAAIADYQERALWNHILGQIEPSDGRVTYFLPMMTGSYKLQNRANDAFWCCQASAMESHTKPGRLIYSKRGDTLYVNQFIASTYDDGEIALRLETDFPTHESARLVVTRGKGRVAIRFPFWATGEGASRYDVRELKAGDAVVIDLPCRFRTEATPDCPERKAVFYGPILLAGRLGCEGVAPYDIRALDYYEHDYKVPARIEHVVLEPTEGWTRLAKPPPHKKVWDDASHPAEPYWGEPNFRTPTGVVVSPLWTIHGERYVVYWD